MTNNQIVEKFFQSFKSGDFITMNSCYADDIVFSDPVYGLLYNEEVKALWEMCCTTAEDFGLSFGNITEVDHEYITCDWSMVYTDIERHRKITKQARAYMKIVDGKIVEHSDGFKLGGLAAQLYGLSGKLFGWTNFLKRKIQKKERKRLDAFMQNL